MASVKSKGSEEMSKLKGKKKETENDASGKGEK
eukprot:CAMPEP_0171453772 /NCGR_PEP_ID=MMETSP0945-20130129/1341_1 /TAXON_ID=109269 /ORGANISM="Vaucheria litorea, Strain CCMP2940" /LENGTH=32 /DNA_ID= /DNA_START= /DNA_END= /DNA_ORIENTATION=